ncbi:MAG TPA: ferritin-like domain-containing protein [Streptosporangiaceae bacterium]|nr:ferritin-like domain-containing protein [Streptosporangiaceae bacterium]
MAGRSAGKRVSLDVQVLQTSASLENLAVACYASAARLPTIRDGDRALATFIARTRAHHAAHAAAYNAAAVREGGRPQRAPDPRYAGAVRHALERLTGAPSVTSLASIVSLLEALEDLKAQSYVRYASLTSPKLRSLLVSVAAVEAQHRSFLLATLQLLSVGAEGLIEIPTDPGELSGVIGVECFPRAFYSTAGASAVDEGVVR